VLLLCHLRKPTCCGLVLLLCLQVDFIAVSFVRTADVITNLRSYIETRTASAAGLQEAGKHGSVLQHHCCYCCCCCCISSRLAGNSWVQQRTASTALQQHQQAGRQQVGVIVEQHKAAQ
jgi:hypothetical protein